jgi:hypothetical protein
MSAILGRTQAVGLGKESVAGTAVAATKWIPHQELTVEDAKETITDNSAFGTRFDILAVDTSQEWAEGNLNGIIYDRSFGLIAHAALGSVSTGNHATASGVKVHTFTTANTLPTYTLSKKDGNESVRHAYGMLNQLEISVEAGGYASFTSSWMTRKGADVSNTVSLSAENRFAPRHVKVYVADDVAGLDSADPSPFTSLTFTYNNNLITDPTLGSIDPTFYPGTVNTSISFSKLYLNTDFKDLVFGTSAKALRIAMINDDIEIGTGTPTNPSIVLDFEPGFFSEWSREGGLGDLKTENISLQPVYSTSASKAFTLKATNTETSY